MQSRGGGEEQNRGQGKKWKLDTAHVAFVELIGTLKSLLFGLAGCLLVLFSIAMSAPQDRDLSSCHLGPAPALGKVPGTGQVLHNSIKWKN